MAHPSSSTQPFAHDAALLNPAFESYKVISGEEEDRVARQGSSPHLQRPVRQDTFPLPGEVSGASGPGHEYGYKQLKDWAGMQHLVPGRAEGQAAYLDKQGFVILVVVDELATPTYFPVHHISPHNASDGVERPALVALGPDQWLVSDGEHSLCLLETFQHAESKRWCGQVRRTWRLPASYPFRIVAASEGSVEGDTVHVVLQRARRMEARAGATPGLGSAPGAVSGKVYRSSQVVFDLIKAQATRADHDAELHVDATYTLEEAPYSVQVDAKGVVVTLSEYPVQQEDESGKQAPSSPPPKKKSRTHLDEQDGSEEPKEPEVPSVRRLLPFAWLQSSDSVTVAWKMPTRVRKEDVRCTFHASHLDLDLSLRASAAPARIVQVEDEESRDDQQPLDITDANVADLERGRYLGRPFWSDIDASSSVWTWEQPSRAEKYNLLTLHLDKKHAGTRWTSVFRQKNAPRSVMQAEENGDDEEDEDGAELEDVPETLDPSDFLNMLEGLDKYTADENRGGAARSIGGAGSRDGPSSSVLQDGLEEEDAMVGRPCIFSVLRDGRVEALPGTQTLLASPIPSTHTRNEQGVMLRQDLDGLFFSSSHPARFTHSDTLPALSYVLASKRNAQRVYTHRRNSAPEASASAAGPHHPLCVLVFEGSDGSEMVQNGGAGNLFVYYSPKQATAAAPSPIANGAETNRRLVASHGLSRVVRLGLTEESSSGLVIGSAAVRLPGKGGAEKQDVVLVLCQRRLLILHHIL